MREFAVRVSGMDCPACASQLERMLGRIDRVSAARGSYAAGAVSLIAADDIDLVRVDDCVHRSGFALPRERVALACEGDSAAIDELAERLGDLFGVASVCRDGAAIELELWPVGLKPRELLARARGCGVDAHVTSFDGGDGQIVQDEQIMLLRRLILAAALTAPLLWNLSPWVQFALASAVEFGPGRVFWRGAWRSLRSGRLGMDALIALSTASIYIYSAWVSLTVTRDIQIYFMSQCLLVTLILFGRYLECVARGETVRSLRSLMRLQPRRALVDRGGEPLEVDVDELDEGDVVIVRAGERVAADGELLAGELVVDESMLTGESAPVSKSIGDAVFGGTLNRSGSARISVGALGEASRLHQIIDAVRRAQSSRAPIQEVADRIAAVFVPAVLLIAAATFLTWYLIVAPNDASRAILASCGVLIVACPCALGLATPACVMVGTGRAAELGILFRDATQLQLARSVRCVVFDKTGTLTYGAPEVSEVRALGDVARDELLALACACERASAHPFAAAIVRRADRMGGHALPLPAVDVAERVGLGVQATVAGRRVAVGGRQMMSGLGIAIGSTDRDGADGDEGRSLVRIAVDGALAGEIEIVDAVRGDAVRALRELRDMDVACVLATGDEQPVARSVAGSIGIDVVRADMSPENKEALVRELRSGGVCVAAIGDGVNDAPALAAADVSFAMGTGVDVAMDTAGVVLVGGNLSSLPRALRLSKQVMRTVHGNLAWALAYNAAFVPLAAAGIVNPSIAAAAMSLSSIVVLMRSLRLQKAEA